MSIIGSGIIKHFNKLIDVYEHHHENVNDTVGGKLFAMAAKLELGTHNYGNALLYAMKAQAINEKAGVKTLAKDIAKKLGKEITI